MRIKPAILFRVDGGRVWGVAMGHIKRSLVLAKALANQYHFIFVMKAYADGVSFVKKQGYQVEEIPIVDDRDETLINLCENYSPKKIIFDLFRNSYDSVFEYAREKKIQTIVFDITGKCKGIPDILINDSFVPSFVQYPHLSGKTRLYCGPKYFLLDRPSKIIPLRKAVKNVMITMGGADPADLTVKVLSSLVGNFSRFRIHVVLGPAYVGKQRILDLATGQANVRIYENPRNLFKLISVQDVVISAAGRTLYECAYFGRPVAVVPSIKPESISSKEFARCTGSLDIGLWDERKSPGKLKAAIDKYNEDYFLRKSIFQKSRHLVDGFGIKRVTRILKLSSTNKTQNLNVKNKNNRP